MLFLFSRATSCVTLSNNGLILPAVLNRRKGKALETTIFWEYSETQGGVGYELPSSGRWP